MLIPLSVDVPMDRKPWTNYAIMASIIFISLTAFCEPGFFESVFEVPLGSTALHIGILHLVGNMLFLWVFGNAVNYKFGQLGYLGLYVAVAIGGELAHFAFDGRPAVGASGAVNGIMGAYLVYFSRNDVTVFWMFYFRGGTSSLSSGKLLLFYVGWDILTTVIDTQPGVAVWAHLGGFATGLSIALFCLIMGWVKPGPDEESILHVLGVRADR